MIGKAEILARAAEWKLPANVVEKDYVLGWLLCAISMHPVAGTMWVFKGGTCIKKCFLETYRFSEDIDFTFLPVAPYSATDIAQSLREACARVNELSGIEFPDDLIVVDSLTNKANQPTYRARISYRGPLQPGGALPRIIVDITKHEVIVDEPMRRTIFHSYPDRLPEEAKILSYSMEELLAEKTRALRERTRPRDLYDVVYLGQNMAPSLDAVSARDIFDQKCKAKNIQPPTPTELIAIASADAELASEWATCWGISCLAYPTLRTTLVVCLTRPDGSYHLRQSLRRRPSFPPPVRHSQQRHQSSIMDKAHPSRIFGSLVRTDCSSNLCTTVNHGWWSPTP